jgi:hypothetical protein
VASFQQFSFLHLFLRGHSSAKYNAEWIHAIGQADLLIQQVYAPNNTKNFLEPAIRPLLKTGNYKRILSQPLQFVYTQSSAMGK